MYGIAFEWDGRKDSANQRKHAVGFAEARTVFGDPLSLTIPDRYHSIDEERLVTIGMSSEARLLVVVHTDKGGSIRLISARASTKHERNRYEENLN